MLPSGLTPVPHVERMDAMIGMTVAIHVSVGWITGKFALEVLFQLERVGGFTQTPMEKFDVARMMLGVELVAQRMTDDHRSAWLYQRLVAEHVEQITQSGALDQHRIHDRIDIVGTDVGHAHDQDVRLSLDWHRILLKHTRERLTMDS